ncbi:trypsin-like peptidase domain-containing protein [Bradyrhizobium sp. NAS96.2]|uniref:S1C family serine protease n=1 Tax=Bradyrhizobium sp. NAS96.2 TaxID=1680160 RepID=UPI001FDA125D|nr:trypsin-like peptidase domain-containing protein [Bradyrhizobium sp. NAS96.2]
MQTLAPLVGKIIRTVVSIKVDTGTAATSGSINSGPPMTKEVSGAGVIIKSESGLIVTSNHLINGAKALSVELSDGRRFEAKFVVADERFDLAMLRVSASGLTAATVGRSIDAEPGDFVLAVGGTAGPAQSVSFGIVSALHRSRAGIPCQDLIQTDALLDSGSSSGGPLFNLRGEVIGIVVATTGEAERGFGLAIPSDAIDRLFVRLN